MLFGGVDFVVDKDVEGDDDDDVNRGERATDGDDLSLLGGVERGGNIGGCFSILMVVLLLLLLLGC